MYSYTCSSRPSLSQPDVRLHLPRTYIIASITSGLCDIVTLAGSQRAWCDGLTAVGVRMARNTKSSRQSGRISACLVVSQGASSVASRFLCSTDAIRQRLNTGREIYTVSSWCGPMDGDENCPRRLGNCAVTVCAANGLVGAVNQTDVWNDLVTDSWSLQASFYPSEYIHIAAQLLMYSVKLNC